MVNAKIKNLNTTIVNDTQNSIPTWIMFKLYQYFKTYIYMIIHVKFHVI